MSSIGLDELDTLALYNRIDKKYVLGDTELLHFLQYVQQNDYQVLKVNNATIQEYQTRYLDTANFQFYLEHHNQRGNRMKVRIRTYKNSGISFLEIKRRTNSGETQKKRITYKKETQHSDDYNAFLWKYTKVDPKQLKPIAYTNFNRITFVSKEFQERVTLDFDIELGYNQRSVFLENKYILEVKKTKGTRAKGAVTFLKQSTIRPLSISKYCLSLAALNWKIKRNSFKPLMIKLKIYAHGNNH